MKSDKHNSEINDKNTSVKKDPKKQSVSKNVNVTDKNEEKDKLLRNAHSGKKNNLHIKKNSKHKKSRSRSTSDSV